MSGSGKNGTKSATKYTDTFVLNNGLFGSYAESFIVAFFGNVGQKHYVDLSKTYMILLLLG
jgi:hypothetical protein